MRRNMILLVVAVAAVGIFVYLASPRDEERDEVERLARVAEARRAAALRQQTTVGEDKAAEFDRLAREGKGQGVPDHLVVRAVPEGGYWFVGDPDSKSGVEIPFAPGRLPTPPPADLPPTKQNPGFVGAAACAKCHKQKHESFIQTAHHRTSQVATRQNVTGSFQEGKNRMKTGNANVHFTMTEHDDRLFQRVAFHGWQFEVPMDVITGSSKMAQTYLYWHGDQLYQMNVTHLSELDDWINSPGYIDGDAAYARPIKARCLECHTTYVDLRQPPNHYTPSSLILGISCERCHGPGTEHIEFHESNPGAKESQYVSVPSKLSRQQQLDICGQCHNGLSPLKGDPFQFRPGDRLSDHYIIGEATTVANSVHTSNQLSRLSESECFKQSEMACAECHDPHQNERGQMAVFSQRCLECHQSEHCGMRETVGANIDQNCIDCHMPRRSGDHLRLESSTGSIFPPLRDHYIRIDREATKAFLDVGQLDAGQPAN